MQLSTLDEIKTKLKYDSDIFDGDFVDLDVELLGYINEAIDDAEATILKLYEDYFLKSANISLVTGTQSYSLPTDIYSAKVRALFYDDGTKKYEIKRIRRLIHTLNVETSDDYQYVMTNDTVSASTGNFKIKLYPTSRETSSTNVTVWYIRNAKRLSSDSDYCDIPEFINFIYAHVKWNLASKEKLPVDLATAEKRLQFQKDLMETTLSDMVPDEGNSIEPDVSFYEDFNSEPEWS